MLQSMRVLAQSWIFKSLMLLLVASFSIWGIGDIFRGNLQEKAVAKVGSDKITVAALERAFKEAMPEARKVFGPQLTETEARQVGVLDRTLNGLMQKSAMQQEVKKLGFNVSNKAIMEGFANEPQLQDKNGRFDLTKWRRLLAQSGQSEAFILNSERDYRGRRLLLSSLVEGLSLPNLITKDLYHARGDKRILEVLSLRHDALKNIATPDDKALHAYYDKHAEDFTAPEYRSITIAVLSPDSLLKNISPSDEEMKQAYDERKDSLVQPERRDILQVVLQDPEKAKTLAAAAEKSGDLASAAKAMKLTAVPISGIDDKSVMHELYTSVFALSQGQISQPIKSQLGYHVVQVKAIHAGGVPSFDAVKNEIRNTLKNEQVSDVLSKTVNQLDDELAAGHTLEDIADTLKMRLIKIPALTSQGFLQNGKEPNEMPNKADVLKTAFSQASGDVSPVMDDGKGSYMVVRTDDVQPSQVRPFDSVKADVVKRVMAEEQATAARRFAEDAAKAIREGAPFSKYAGQAGVNIHFSKPLSMLGDKDDSLPEAVMAQAFQIGPKDVDVVSTKDRDFVLRLAKIESLPAPGKMDPQIVQLNNALAQRQPVDLLDQYMNYLKNAYPATIDISLLDDLKKREGN